jgi:hypothetical protein
VSVARAFQSPAPVWCAVTRCRTVVEPGKVMCLTHWSMVPRNLQLAIGHSYRARQMGAYQTALTAALGRIETETGAFTGIFEKRTSAPVREGGGLPPVPPPSKPVRVRRPRLTMKRLAIMEIALTVSEQEGYAEAASALLWVRGERAKRRARLVARS